MNKRKVYNMASKKECKHSGPLVLQQAQYRAGVAELVLEDFQNPLFSGGPTLTAPGPVPKKNFDPKPFSVGHMGPNLSFHTPFTPLPDTFLVILVKRMTLKKNLPPPC